MSRSTALDLARSAKLTKLAETRWGPKRRWRCVYCGRVATAVDHFWPTDRGGEDIVQNLMPACLSCNASKRASDPVEWMRRVGIPEHRIQQLLLVAETALWAAPPDLVITRVTPMYGFRKPRRARNSPNQGKTGR